MMMEKLLSPILFDLFVQLELVDVKNNQNLVLALYISEVGR